MTEKKQALKERNLTNLKNYLFSQQQGTKNQMAQAVGISTVTVNSLVSELVEEHYFLEGELIQQKMGRPAIEYHFNFDYHHYLLLSIQDNKGSLCIVSQIANMAGIISYSNELPFEPMTITTFLQVISQVLIEQPAIQTIALSFPGKIIDGIVQSSWYDKFDGWAFEKEVAETFNLPIFIENDAHIATIGYSINHQLPTTHLQVGIYYPENSMPGISIFSNNQLLVGKNGLAGEGKYLPCLIDTQVPLGFKEELTKLIDILCLYNAVIAPHSFIIYKEKLTQTDFECLLASSHILAKQPNKPIFYLADDFNLHIQKGLHWLAMSDVTSYQKLLESAQINPH